MNIRIKQQIENILETLRPFEVIEIHTDSQGKVEHYFVKRTQKIIIKEEIITEQK